MDLQPKELPHENMFLLEANADYCDNAPECYILDENGNQLFWTKILNTISKYKDKEWIINKVDLTYYAPDQEQIIDYLYRLNPDPDMLYTFRAESGNFSPQRVGVTDDRGMCQLSPIYHSAFINSPDFNDWHKQAEYCVNVYKKRPTAFYGYYKRHAQKKFFKFY